MERPAGAQQFGDQPFTLQKHDAGDYGAAAVLLLHGFPRHAGLWAPVLPALHELGLRTLAPDQRGYSPLPQPTDVEAYLVDELVADAVAVVDDAGVPDALVVGHDWGALV